MELDEIDIKVLRENFDDETISEIDSENVSKIMKYLKDNGVYYAKDLFISSLDLFLLPSDNFIDQFEKLKIKLGSNYVEELGEDTSLIELMYED
jgi:phospholipid N-methyltransferase